MKRKFSVIFILMLSIVAFNLFFGIFNVKAQAEEAISITSKSAILLDYDSGTVVFEKNADERLPIASMTKVMTLILCFDNLNSANISLDQNVIISENAAGMGGSQVFIEKNGEYTVGTLMKSIVVASANDACVAMAEHLYGSESAFVEKMNEKAQELDMQNTNFVNCTGLPQAGQYSSARDVSKMFCNLLNNDEYFRFSKIWTDVVTHPNDRITEISNTNKLVRFYQGCDSGKTGYTSESGHCLVASAKRNDMRLVSVVIKAPNSKVRFGEVSAMFNYGFANYTNKVLYDKNSPLSINVKVKDGKKDTVEVVPEKSISIFSKREEKRNVEVNFEPISLIKAPIRKGDVVGKLKIFEKGVLISSVNVLSNENIDQKTYFDHISDIGRNWNLI